MVGGMPAFDPSKVTLNKGAAPANGDKPVPVVPAVAPIDPKMVLKKAAVKPVADNSGNAAAVANAPATPQPLLFTSALRKTAGASPKFSADVAAKPAADAKPAAQQPQSPTQGMN